MREGPDIARLAALIGDPVRETILSALLAGRALTAGELARAAGVTAQTASGHLGYLTQAELLAVRKQGRHRYYEIASSEVGHALETLAGIAATTGHLRHRTGPRDDDLRAARVCYDHLAGARGVQMFDALVAQGSLALSGDGLSVSEAGYARFQIIGIDLTPLDTTRRPACRACLDWSERRSHLAGALGALIFRHMEREGWITRPALGRHVWFTAHGAAAFDAAFTPVCGPASEASGVSSG